MPQKNKKKKVMLTQSTAPLNMPHQHSMTSTWIRPVQWRHSLFKAGKEVLRTVHTRLQTQRNFPDKLQLHDMTTTLRLL